VVLFFCHCILFLLQKLKLLLWLYNRIHCAMKRQRRPTERYQNYLHWYGSRMLQASRVHSSASAEVNQLESDVGPTNDSDILLPLPLHHALHVHDGQNIFVSFQQTCHPYRWAFYTWHNDGHTAGEIDHFTSCAQITLAILLSTEHRNDNFYDYQMSMVFFRTFTAVNKEIVCNLASEVYACVDFHCFLYAYWCRHNKVTADDKVGCFLRHSVDVR